MTQPALPRRLSLLLAALFTLAGCGSGPRSAGTVAPPVAVATGWTDREEVGRAIELLGRGEVEPARKALARVLKRAPNDPIAADLAQQIDADPAALLGARSFPYTVREGDTLSALAGRFLGNPTRFYALGRYNGLAFPVTLEPGRALRIPGEPKVARPQPAPVPVGRAKPAVAAPKPAAPKPAAADPARGARLRAAALEQLNRGAVDRAVVLLRQADRVAPGDALVRRDLDRALRIRRAVQGRR